MSEHKFKVGDRVKVVDGHSFIKAGSLGTILDDSLFPFVGFDEVVRFGHDCGGLCADGFGFSISESQLEIAPMTPYRATTEDLARHTELLRWASSLELGAHKMPDTRKSIHQIPSDDAKYAVIRAINALRAELETIRAGIVQDIQTTIEESGK
jgi:hypothetical protein